MARGARVGAARRRKDVDGGEAAGEPRTAEVWGRRCEAAARALDAGWALNPLAVDPRVELLRPHASGLLASLSFVRVDATWHLGFALTFTARPSAALTTPLLAGARFDPRRTVAHELHAQLGLVRGPDPTRHPPPATWAAGEWRSNTLDLVARGLAVPEPLLAPAYLAPLRAGAARLVALFRRAQDLVPALADALAQVPAARPVTLARVAEAFPHAVEGGRRRGPAEARLEPGWAERARELDAAEAAGLDPGAVLAVLGAPALDAPTIARGQADAHPVEAVIAASLRVLAPERDRLAELTRLARGLAG